MALRDSALIDDMRQPAAVRTSNGMHASVLHMIKREALDQMMIVFIYGRHYFFILEEDGFFHRCDNVKVIDNHNGAFRAEPADGNVHYAVFNSGEFELPYVQMYENDRQYQMQKLSPHDYTYELMPDGTIKATEVIVDVPLLSMCEIFKNLRIYSDARVDVSVDGEQREEYLPLDLWGPVNGLFRLVMDPLENPRAFQWTKAPRHLLTTFRWLISRFAPYDSDLGFELLMQHGDLMTTALLEYMQIINRCR